MSDRRECVDGSYHDFRPRFDREPIDKGVLEPLLGLIVNKYHVLINHEMMEDVLDAMRSQIYVRDICVRCGETKERDKRTMT